MTVPIHLVYTLVMERMTALSPDTVSIPWDLNHLPGIDVGNPDLWTSTRVVVDAVVTRDGVSVRSVTLVLTPVSGPDVVQDITATISPETEVDICNTWAVVQCIPGYDLELTSGHRSSIMPI